MTLHRRRHRTGAGPAAEPGPGAKIVKVLTTTDHKTIGLMYLVTSFWFFMAAARWP